MTPPPEKGTNYAHPLPPLSLDCSDELSEESVEKRWKLLFACYYLKEKSERI